MANLSPIFDVTALESQLRQSLQPVQPRQAFVGHLQTRLVTRPTLTVERRANAISLLLIAFALISGLILMVGLRRWRTQSSGQA